VKESCERKVFRNFVLDSPIFKKSKFSYFIGMYSVFVNSSSLRKIKHFERKLCERKESSEMIALRRFFFVLS
jgi:hypothetical protein